jgi:hypothetical protein
MKNALICLSVVAAADLSALQFHNVGLDSTGAAVPITTAGARPFGVLQNKPKAGQTATVAIGGVTNAKVGAAVVAGANAVCDNQGRIDDLTTAGQHRVGIIMQSAGAAGEIVSLLIANAGAVNP